MKRINVLDPFVAQLIAAGEVTENPASVVKELVENSIDAGATRITVEIKNGGVKYIKVSDNGHGMYRDDVKVAFKRHATSKIHNKDEIEKIASLGFRGEALASICSVSKLELITRSKEESVGSSLTVIGGKYGDIVETGCPVGTTICVKDLFFNTPARMKFLKKDVAEGNKVASVIDKLALSHPEISFKFIRDNKQVLCTPGDKNISSVVYSVYGKDFFDGMLPLEYKFKNISVSGFVSAPEKCKASKSMQIFFINGRFIKNKIISSAIEEAFKNSIMVGKSPYCVIYLDIPYELVDINVHPTKMEVKFANEKDVFEVVYYAVKTALMNNNKNVIGKELNLDSEKLIQSDIKKDKDYELEVKTEVSEKNIHHTPYTPSTVEINFSSLKFKDSTARTDNFKNFNSKTYDFPVFNSISTTPKSINTIKKVIDFPIIEDNTITEDKINRYKEAESKNEVVANFESLSINTGEISKSVEYVEENESSNILCEAQKPSFKIAGEIFDCYIIVEIDNKLILVDKHAAHERLIFEKIRNQSDVQNSQTLIKPLTLTLEKIEYSAVVDNLNIFSKAGYDISDFGSGMIVVRAIPMYETLNDLENSIIEMANCILENKKSTETKKLEWIYHNIACRSAVKAGMKSSKEEIVKLLDEMLKNPDLKYCPHGRPIYVEITKKFIEKQFGRT